MKQLDEVCERFDYVSLSMASGCNWDIVFGTVSYINKKYPGCCIHLLGTSSFNGLSWGGLMKHCDTMDCTGWCSPARYGLTTSGNLEPQWGKWVKPGEDFINQHLLRLFPRKPGKDKDPISGWTYTNREAALWVICQAYCELTRACLYGHQKQWENGSFRGVIQKILQGKGAELQESDITAPIYDMEFFHHDKTGFDFWAPVDHEKGWHYKDKFKNTVNFIKAM